MEGKVELPIERYEELTKIERDGLARVNELEANMDMVLIKQSVTGWGYSGHSSTTYVLKDKYLKEAVDNMEKAKKVAEIAKAKNAPLEAELQKYKEASFWKRFMYLWTVKI